MKSAKLQTWSKKSKNDARRQFIDRRSNVDKFADQPFFVHWENGRVVSVYAPAAESLAEENFKKGIAALFQVHVIHVSRDALIKGPTETVRIT